MRRFGKAVCASLRKCSSAWSLRMGRAGDHKMSSGVRAGLFSLKSFFAQKYGRPAGRCSLAVMTPWSNASTICSSNTRRDVLLLRLKALWPWTERVCSKFGTFGTEEGRYHSDKPLAANFQQLYAARYYRVVSAVSQYLCTDLGSGPPPGQWYKDGHSGWDSIESAQP